MGGGGTYMHIPSLFLLLLGLFFYLSPYVFSMGDTHTLAVDSASVPVELSQLKHPYWVGRGLFAIYYDRHIIIM